jgi:hypothetical protein
VEGRPFCYIHVGRALGYEPAVIEPRHGLKLTCQYGSCDVHADYLVHEVTVEQLHSIGIEVTPAVPPPDTTDAVLAQLGVPPPPPAPTEMPELPDRRTKRTTRRR